MGSVIVGVVGLVCAGGSLVPFAMTSGLFAEARTSDTTGSGIDVFVRTPFPSGTSEIVFDVEAHGGKRTRIEQVVVRSGADNLAVTQGEGTRWEDTLLAQGPGAEAVQIRFPVRLATRPGPTLALDIVVDYVVALADDGRTPNERRSASVRLVLDIYSSSARHAAQLARVLGAVGCFLVWFMIIWGVARCYEAGTDKAARRDIEGIGLLMGFLGGSLLGYWLFTWRIATALELHALGWSVLLTVFWSLAPLGFVWWWNVRRKKRSRLPSARVVAR
jgi:hypothetical protein